MVLFSKRYDDVPSGADGGIIPNRAGSLRQKHKMFKRAREGRSIIPIKAHITDHICLTNNDMLVSVIEFHGINYDDKDLAQLRRYKDTINNLFRNIYDSRIGLWSCMMRRRAFVEVNKALDNHYAAGFAGRYETNLNQATYDNRYCLAIVYRPIPRTASIIKTKDKRLYRELIDSGKRALDELVDMICESLLDYGPKILGSNPNGFSDIARVYSELLYLRGHNVKIGSYNLADAIYNRRVICGNELIEVRHNTQSSYAAALGIKDYYDSTEPDMFFALTKAPVEFNFVQSFLFVDKHKAHSELTKQHNVLVATEDDARSQITDIEQGLDDLVSGRCVFGEHNASLIVHSASKAELVDAINSVEVAYQDSGIVVVREDIASEAHFLSQLPGNYLYRPRPSLISSLNFGSMMQMYSPPIGEKDGHHWGKAIMPLLTTSGEPYYFSNFVDDTGSVAVTGMTGSGKTVFINAMLAFYRRDGIRHVFFDKDEGAKICINALGGRYQTIRIGEPTGFNPFSLEDNHQNRYFIIDLIKLLVGEPFTSAHLKIVENAVTAVYGLEQRNRRLASLIGFLDTTEEEGIASRLREWVGDNRNGWVFDNETDDIELGSLTAFDVTQFLDHPQIRTPIMSYLIHRIMKLIDGTPIAIWMDEFWKLLEHEYFRDEFLNNKYKTIRKENGCLILSTQSPSDALRSPIARTLLEQTATKVFLPNEEALETDYTEGFTMTRPEWEFFSQWTKMARRVLIKQNNQSVACALPLTGLIDDLNILSGTKANNRIFDSLVDQDGNLPNNWIDQFHSKIRSKS